MRKATQMSDAELAYQKSALREGLCAALPYDHPMRTRYGGGALRETRDRAAKATRALQRAGLLKTVTAEIESDIERGAREILRKCCGLAEQEVQRLRKALSRAEDRLSEAKMSEENFGKPAGSKAAP